MSPSLAVYILKPILPWYGYFSQPPYAVSNGFVFAKCVLNDQFEVYESRKIND